MSESKLTLAWSSDTAYIHHSPVSLYTNAWVIYIVFDMELISYWRVRTVMLLWCRTSKVSHANPRFDGWDTRIPKLRCGKGQTTRVQRGHEARAFILFYFHFPFFPLSTHISDVLPNNHRRFIPSDALMNDGDAKHLLSTDPLLINHQLWCVPTRVAWFCFFFVGINVALCSCDLSFATSRSPINDAK